LTKTERQSTFICVGLISIAIIAQQLALIRIFSNTQWYHFAFVIISIALLGFGVAGTILSLWRPWFSTRFEQVFSLSTFGTGFSLCLIVPALNSEVLFFDSYQIFEDSHQIFALLFSCLVLSIPFFFGALAIGVAFVQYNRQIGSLYFYNLVGSALGGPTFLALAWLLYPSQMPAVLALFPLAAFLFIQSKRANLTYKIIGLVSITIAAGLGMQSMDLPVSEYKSLSKTLLLPNTSVTMERNSPYGLVQVVQSPHVRHAPGLSLTFPGEVPVRNVVFNDGNWVGPFFNALDSNNLGRYTTLALPYVLRRPGTVLILEAGSGESIKMALEHDVAEITATESNRTLVDFLSEIAEEGADYIFSHPKVLLNKIEPRTFLSTSDDKYDLIALPIINVFGGASGTKALQEQYLLTQEALQAMWSSLKADGMITISCWIDYPSRGTLRIVSTLIDALERAGIQNADLHVAAVKNWSLLTFCLSKSPISTEEEDRLREFCDRHSFDPVLLPNLKQSDIDRFNILQDTSFYDYLNMIVSDQRKLFWSNYAFRVQPVLDNNPYFHQHLRPLKLNQVLGDQSMLPAIFMELGYFLVIAAFAVIAVLAFLLIIIPLLLAKVPGREWLWALIYFAGIGAGYMFVEIVLIHQFILYAGNAVYSTALVLTCLLLASGAGSLYSEKIKSDHRRLIRVPLLIAGLLFFYSFALGWFLQSTIGLSQPLKVAITLVLISPIGFIMGMPFPSAMSYLGLKNKETVPWAWGVNSYSSVISTSAATICAVEFGFSWLLIAAGSAYLVVLLATLFLSRT